MARYGTPKLASTQKEKKRLATPSTYQGFQTLVWSMSRCLTSASGVATSHFFFYCRLLRKFAQLREGQTIMKASLGREWFQWHFRNERCESLSCCKRLVRRSNKRRNILNQISNFVFGFAPCANGSFENQNTKVFFQTENPKQPGSKAFDRYQK